MARTFTFTDKQADDLLHIVRREFFASHSLQREKDAAEAIYMVLTAPTPASSGPSRAPPYRAGRGP